MTALRRFGVAKIVLMAFLLGALVTSHLALAQSKGACTTQNGCSGACGKPGEGFCCAPDFSGGCACTGVNGSCS